MSWIIMTFQSFKIQKNPQTVTTGSNDIHRDVFLYDALCGNLYICNVVIMQ